MQAAPFFSILTLWKNLELSPKDAFPRVRTPEASDKDFLLDGLQEALAPSRLEKIWETIWKRWQRYEDFCN